MPGRPTDASRHIQSGRRSASPWPWPRGRASCCSTSRRPSGLDSKAPDEFTAPLRRMSDPGTDILMATHELFRAEEYGTRVGIMRHGRLVETRGTEKIGHVDLERIYLDDMRD